METVTSGEERVGVGVAIPHQVTQVSAEVNLSEAEKEVIEYLKTGAFLKLYSGI